MKQVLLVFLILTNLYSEAQAQRITIQGKVVDKSGRPISDVYILNLVTNEKDISLKNGVFTIKASPTDSLILSHISYFRKVVTIHSLLLNPEIILESENINIQEVTVSPDQKSELDLANENIQEIEWDTRPQPDDNFTESERAKQLMSGNNKVMQTEASSVSILRFSIGDMFEKWKKKREKRKKSRQYLLKKNKKK